MASSTAPGHGGELNGGELNGLSGDTARRRSTTASSRRARRERAVCMVCGMCHGDSRFLYLWDLVMLFSGVYTHSLVRVKLRPKPFLPETVGAPSWHFAQVSLPTQEWRASSPTRTVLVRAATPPLRLSHLIQTKPHPD